MAYACLSAGRKPFGIRIYIGELRKSVLFWLTLVDLKHHVRYDEFTLHMPWPQKSFLPAYSFPHKWALDS